MVGGEMEDDSGLLKHFKSLESSLLETADSNSGEGDVEGPGVLRHGASTFSAVESSTPHHPRGSHPGSHLEKCEAFAGRPDLFQPFRASLVSRAAQSLPLRRES